MYGTALGMGLLLGTRLWLLVDKLGPDLLYSAAVLHEFTVAAVRAAKASGTVPRADLRFSPPASELCLGGRRGLQG